MLQKNQLCGIFDNDDVDVVVVVGVVADVDVDTKKLIPTVLK